MAAFCRLQCPEFHMQPHEPSVVLHEGPPPGRPSNVAHIESLVPTAQIVFAYPALSVAAALLGLDRHLGMHFFTPTWFLSEDLPPIAR